MADLVLRSVKGTPLTIADLDGNFTYLNNALGANGSTTVPTPTGTGVPVLSTSPTISGHPTIEGITSTGASGTGKILFNTSPTLITPLLGTPTSGNFTTGTFNWPTFNQNTTGNSATATNVAYSGLTGTVPTWNQNTTGTATGLSSTLVSTSGGTGTSTTAVGDLLYGSATNTWSKLTSVATGNALISGGVSTAPSWGKIGLTTHITGILPVANGGTGNTTGSSASVAWGNITGTVPTWNQNTTGNAATATNVAYSGLTGTVPTWNQNTTGNAATVTNGIYTNVTNTFSGINNFGLTNSIVIGGVSSIPYNGFTAAIQCNVQTGTGLGGVFTCNNGNVPLWCGVSGASAYLLGFAYGTGSSWTSVGWVMTTGTSVLYATASDYRLKQNVIPITNAISRVKCLNPVRFDWITDSSHKTVDGFLAHEVQSVIPESVTGSKDAIKSDGTPDYQGVDQAKIVPLLTAALLEAIARIEVLESKLI
jgi:hypothetical protein